MLTKLVIASGNAGKLREIQQLLVPLKIEVIAQSALNIDEAGEPHCTFVENALAKARHASKHSGLPALADDSGLCVDALQGRPGVHSARYGGEPKDDKKNNQTLLNALANTSNRKAYYYCAIVLVRSHDDPQPLIAEGIWAGEILTSPRGTDGFGYDPLFLDVESDKTGAELSSDAKNKVNHRGKALKDLMQKFELLK